MDIRICALLLLLAVVGSYGEFHAFNRFPREVSGLAAGKEERYEQARIVKRATDDKTTTKSNADTKDATSTTPKSTTVVSTTLKTTPKPTEATTTPSTEGTTKSNKPRIDSRSAIDDEDASPSKPNSDEKKSEKGNDGKQPAMSPRMNPDSNPAGSNVGPGNQLYGSSPFPGYNSIPSYGPNYAYTSTNHGPGGSSSASAGSFASSDGFQRSPGYPAFNTRGAFYDNAPSPFYNPNNYGSGNVWPANAKKPTNDPMQDKPVTNSRSNFDNNDKPSDVGPAQNPNSLPSNGPQNFPTRGFGGPYTPNFDYPAVNSVQGPNYAWTNSGPGYSGASAGASAGAFAGSSGTPTFGTRGGFSDNNAGMGFPDNSAYTPVAVDTGFSFPQPGFGSAFDGFAQHQRMMEEHFRTLQAQIEAHHRAIQEANQLNGIGGGSSDPGVHSSYAGISLGPRGGFQSGQINPVGPGIESRFAEDLPAPSGGQYGVFASSSSSSRTGPDGKTIAHKSSTTGVNDNGKITFRTIQD